MSFNEECVASALCIQLALEVEHSDNAGAHCVVCRTLEAFAHISHAPTNFQFEINMRFKLYISTLRARTRSLFGLSLHRCIAADQIFHFGILITQLRSVFELRSHILTHNF